MIETTITSTIEDSYISFLVIAFDPNTTRDFLKEKSNLFTPALSSTFVILPKTYLSTGISFKKSKEL